MRPLGYALQNFIFLRNDYASENYDCEKTLENLSFPIRSIMEWPGSSVGRAED